MLNHILLSQVKYEEDKLKECDWIFVSQSFEETIKNCNVKEFIYCDPPYRDTTKYKTEEFPYDEFYDWCREMSKNNIVLISEYNMPNDFECIWSKNVSTSMDNGRDSIGDKSNRVEKLFIIRS